MNENHYAPPIAVVADITDEMSRPRPGQVIWAVRLLWATMIVWVLQDAFSVRSSPASVIAVHVVLTGVTVAIAGFVYSRIHRGYGWARNLMLVWTVPSTAAILFAPSYSTDSTLDRVLTAVKETSDVVCMYLLFASPGSVWFKMRAR
jgi:hypothetical protein